MAYGTLNAGAITPGSGATLTISEAVTFSGAVTGKFKLARNEGLVVKYASATTVDIDADFLTVFDSNGYAVILPTVNLTANITSSGVNGLDTGSEAAIWYHIYVIYNGTTVASLLSASATSPTMPSGYTFKKYVGAVYNPSSSFRDFHQVGNSAVFLLINVLSAATSTGFAVVDLSTAIPTLATRVEGTVLSVDSGGTTAGIYVASKVGGTGRQFFYSSVVGSSNNTIRSGFSLNLLEVQKLYYANAGDNSDIEISSYSFSNII